MPQKISGKIAKIESEPDISMLISGKITVVYADQNNEDLTERMIAMNKKMIKSRKVYIDYLMNSSEE